MNCGAREPGESASIKVLVVSAYFPAHGGGVEVVAEQLARRAAASGGMRITWCASGTDAAPARDDSFTPIGMAAWNFLEGIFGIPWPIWRPSAARLLWATVGESDIVHLHDVLYPGSILAGVMARLRRKPLVVTQHIGLVPYRNPVFRYLMCMANLTIGRYLLQSADQVIFISQSAFSYFDAICRWKRKPRLVPNGVDTRLYRRPTAEESSAARRSLGLSRDARVCLFVGRFVEKKGLPLLRDMAGKLPEVRWLLAGRGPIDPRQWDFHNVNVFSDRRLETLRELFWAADLLVLPSVGEGFPLVVQEAMACGLQVLVSNEVAGGCPLAGVLMHVESVDSANTDRWTSRVSALLDNSATRGPQSLTDFAARHWSWDVAGKLYIDLYRQLSMMARKDP